MENICGQRRAWKHLCGLSGALHFVFRSIVTVKKKERESVSTTSYSQHNPESGKYCNCMALLTDRNCFPEYFKVSQSQMDLLLYPGSRDVDRRVPCSGNGLTGYAKVYDFHACGRALEPKHTDKLIAGRLGHGK